MIPFTTSNSGITAYVKGKACVVGTDHPKFAIIQKRLLELNMTEDEFMAAYDTVEFIFKYSNGKIRVDGDKLFYNEKELHNSLVVRMIDLLKKHQPVGNLINFLTRLEDNPSYRAVTELYDFLEACSLPITADGHFLAYKKVDKDYMSIHADPRGQKMNNSIGQKVSMPRNEVDENSERTCSNGLHCCSFGYLENYSSSSGNDKIVIVKVDPKNVVAVPKDYDNQKMRVCEYEVVGEIPNDQYTQIKDRYSTTEYSDDDDEYDDDEGKCWLCKDKNDSWDGDFVVQYSDMSANQAKSMFSREYEVPYINVRIRKAQ